MHTFKKLPTEAPKSAKRTVSRTSIPRILKFFYGAVKSPWSGLSYLGVAADLRYLIFVIAESKKVFGADDALLK